MDLPLSVLSQVAAILEKQGIRYVLVGSFASSIHGMYRSTADIDIVADITTDQVHPLFEETVFVATAEDTILAKLRLYRAGHETSSNQWNDVLGILGTSLHALDFEYLRAWAEKLGLTDLFERALNHVREESGK